MDTLKQAIDAEGGVGKLATSLGVRQSVVSNWKARGLPKPWEIALRLKYASGKKAKRKQPTEA